MKTTKIFAFALLLAFFCTAAWAAFPFGNIGLGVDEPLAQLDVDGTNILRGGSYFIMYKEDGEIANGEQYQLERLNSAADFIGPGFFFYSGSANEEVLGIGRESYDTDGELALLGKPSIICYSDEGADIELKTWDSETEAYAHYWHLGSGMYFTKADRQNATNSYKHINYFDWENYTTVIEPPTDGAGFSGTNHAFNLVFPAFDSDFRSVSRQTILIVGAQDYALNYKLTAEVYCKLPGETNFTSHAWFESTDTVADDIEIELLHIPGEHARLQLLHIRDAYTGDPVGINVVSDDGYRFLLNGH